MRSKVCAWMAGGAALLAASAGRAETSAMTDAFVTATARAVTVLQLSDRLALANGSSLQGFAQRDIAVQTEDAEALVAWAQAERRAEWAAANAPTIDGLGRLLYPFSSSVLPLDVGRRAATSADRALLEQLQALQGGAFDALYAESHAVALRRLEDADVDYIKNGDDPALRRLAVRNLPRVRHLLAELRHR